MAQPPVHFKHLTVDDGLVSNHINNIVKDSSGYLWFGTNTGLSRFDGQRFKTYANNPNDPTSLLENSIVNLWIGFDKQLWVRTGKGICIYEEKQDVFYTNVDSVLLAKGFVAGPIRKMLVHDGDEFVLYENGDLYRGARRNGKRKVNRSVGKLHGMITDFCLDDGRNRLYVVTDRGEIGMMDPNTFQLRHQRHFAFEQSVEDSQFRLFVDDQAGVWIYAQNFPFGALYYKDVTSSPQIFRQVGGDVTVNNNYISNIQEMHGVVWLATDHGGINVFDPEKQTVSYLMHDRFDGSSLPYNSTTALYKDQDGILWVGTYKGGVSYYHPDLDYFTLYQQQVGQENSLPFNDINCFVEDKQGIVWIGTNGGGLVRFDPRRQTFESFVHDPRDPNTLGSNVVVSLYIDTDDQLWIGTYHGGLNTLKNGKFRRFTHSSGVPTAINDNSVWALLEDSKQRFWVGTLSGGMERFDRTTDEFTRFRPPYPSDFNASYQSKILADRLGNIWMGTSSGVAKWTTDNRLITYTQNTTTTPLSNNVVSDLLEDKHGHIWVATQAGINILQGEKISYLSTSDGLIDQVVVGLVLDAYGDIWATTAKGISRIQDKSESDRYTIHNYDKSDGLQSSNFNERAAYRLRDGRLLFGGSQGFNITKPQPMQVAKGTAPRVVDFRILGGSEADNRAMIQDWLRRVYENKSFPIPYSIHTWTLVLSDFDFLRQQDTNLQYQIRGLANEWIDIDNMEITLANLPAQDYTVWVRRTNEAGAYAEPIKLLDVTVLAPWWRSSWAYTVYVLLVLGGLYVFRKIEKMRTRTAFNLLQAEEKARHARDMEEMRTRFFTNVSHEFRTPISLIVSPIQQLKKDEQNGDKRKYLDIIERNAAALLNLVNQLLDINKIEKQEHKLQWSQGDVLRAVQRMSEQFKPVAQAKGIHYGIEVPDEDWEVQLDFDKLERIILNLLSNAFKFTPTGESVRLTVQVDRQASVLTVEVVDTGVGISKDNQKQVFERYYQAPDSWAHEQGSGLGLAIVQEFVQVMSGTVAFVPETKRGTALRVELPVRMIAAKKAETAACQLVIENSEPGIRKRAGASKKIRKDREVGLKSEHILRILVVEDHHDYAFYLQDNLKAYFEVVVYATVEEAIRQLPAYRPDVIVSDLQLPGMSGLDFCRQIRAHDRTKHIPFLLISALGDEHKHVEALQLGASDFMTKPFSFAVFLSKIRALIEQQEVSERLFKRQIDVKLAHAEVDNEDERFVLKMTAIVEKHLQDDTFSVEVLASHMYITRVGLYKKLVSITGFTPTEYIRNIRLNRALDLLKNSQMTISEISYEVGFGNPKQFGKYFKNFYGEVPSAFRK